MSDPSLIRNIIGGPSLHDAPLLASQTALRHILTSITHSDPVPSRSFLIKKTATICNSCVMQSERCQPLGVKGGGGEEGERRRKEGWNNLNKTEGQSNNKMSIPPVFRGLMLISYFYSDLERGVNEGWGRRLVFK